MMESSERKLKSHCCQDLADVIIGVWEVPSKDLHGKPMIFRSTEEKEKVKYCQPARPESFAPHNVYHKPCMAMEVDTVQSLSFQPIRIDRPEPILPHGNLGLSCQRMSGDTINNLSYLPLCMKRVLPFLPCDHDLTGKGPMEEVSTQMHDYVPKCRSKRDLILPFANLCDSKLPLEDKTVQSLSFPCPVLQKRPPSFKPIYKYERPCTAMERSTVQMLSYRPTELGPHWIPPWARREFNKAFEVIDNNTIYRCSYMPSGKECGLEEEEGCCCCLVEEEVF